MNHKGLERVALGFEIHRQMERGRLIPLGLSVTSCHSLTKCLPILYPFLVTHWTLLRLACSPYMYRCLVLFSNATIDQSCIFWFWSFSISCQETTSLVLTISDARADFHWKTEVNFSDQVFRVSVTFWHQWHMHLKYSKLFTSTSSPLKPLGHYQPNLALWGTLKWSFKVECFKLIKGQAQQERDSKMERIVKLIEMQIRIWNFQVKY